LNVCDYMKENLDVRFNITSCITCNKSRCNLHYLEGGGVGLTEENLSDNSNITTCPNCTKSKNNLDYLGGGAAGLTEENLSDNNNTTTCPTENICKLDHLEMGLTVSLIIMIIIQKLLLYYCTILQNSSKEWKTCLIIQSSQIIMLLAIVLRAQKDLLRCTNRFIRSYYTFTPEEILGKLPFSL
jgi:hypothetical protein